MNDPGRSMHSPGWRGEIRTLIGAGGLAVFLVSAIILLGDRATVFGRMTRPLMFWNDSHRSAGWYGEAYFDAAGYPPREISSEDFAACWRTSIFPPDQVPSLVKVSVSCAAYKSGGVWAPTRWRVRLSVSLFECVPGKLTEQGAMDVAAAAITRLFSSDPEEMADALDALCRSDWWSPSQVGAEWMVLRTDGYVHNAISAASFAACVWAFWPRRKSTP